MPRTLFAVYAQIKGVRVLYAGQFISRGLSSSTLLLKVNFRKTDVFR